MLAHGEPAIIHDPENPSAKLWPTRERAITCEEAKRGTEGMCSAICRKRTPTDKKRVCLIAMSA